MTKFIKRWLEKLAFDNGSKSRKTNRIDSLTLFTPHNLAMLSDWLAESGELFVDVYHPRSGGGSSGYFIRSMADLKSLIAQDKWHTIDVTIFREQQFPLRGIANEQLLEQALNMIPDGQWYQYVSLENSVFPDHVAVWGSGDSHAELCKEFAKDLGEQIAIGQNPHDVYLNPEWFDTHPNEVFRATYLCRTVKITRNQDNYPPFENEPDKYKWVIDL
jgi:hypothetical protein